MIEDNPDDKGSTPTPPKLSRAQEMAEFPDMNPGPVLRLSSDGTIEMLNAAARKVLGDQNAVGACWYDVCPGMDTETWLAITKADEPIHFEAGDSDSCIMYTHARRPESGHIFVYGADVTEHRKAEMALAEQTAVIAEMARFPDMNPGPVLRFSKDGKIVLANRAARKLFNKESLVGLNWREVCPDMTDELWNRILASKKDINHEATVGDRFIIFTHTPITEAGNVFVYGADATERRRAEEELAERTAQIAEMARFPDMNPGPVIRFEEDGAIILANRAALTLFEEKSLVGMNWQKVCPNMSDKLWSKIMTSEKDVIHEAKVGEKFITFTHTPKTENGNVFVYGSDVTEQKDAERMLAQSEKMATLGTLSAGVAHELNNPAAAARRGAEHLKEAFTSFQKTMVQVGRLELTDSEYDHLLKIDELARARARATSTLSTLARNDLEQAIEDWLEDHDVENIWEIIDNLVEVEISIEELDLLAADIPADHLELVLCALGQSFAVYQLLQEIHLGTERISSIVGALKEYSYLDKADLLSVDVNRGIRNTLIILNSKLKQGVEVIEELDDNLPEIQAFGSELNQVWTNLIDNAVGAMGGTGTICIRSAVSQDGVMVEIEDNGPGIPKENLQRIFDAFFTTKAVGEGTGLGLHTCYSIVVNKHGGRLDVKSEPGCTCFYVWLPLVAKSNDAVAE